MGTRCGNVVLGCRSPSGKCDEANVVAISKTTVILRNLILSSTPWRHRDWKIHMYIGCVNYSSKFMNISFFIIFAETVLSQVYDEISNHFSETRHKRWPNVTKFLEGLEEGTLLLDVGCGNGKYLCGDRNVYKVLSAI